MEANYSREISVSNTPLAVYKAITTGFNKWWTTNCTKISAIGDDITFKFGSTYWVMRANALEPNKFVELECIEAHHEHEGLPPSILNEWQGSKLKWHIQKTEETTKINFVHDGLIPSLDCYEVCEQGWDYFFVNSLKQYLETGKGTPFEN